MLTDLALPVPQEIATANKCASDYDRQKAKPYRAEENSKHKLRCNQFALPPDVFADKTMFSVVL
jgi:hypothetical protein